MRAFPGVVVLWVLATPLLAGGDEPRQEGVARLRALLRQPLALDEAGRPKAVKEQTEAIEKAASALRTVSELGEVLRLREWEGVHSQLEMDRDAQAAYLAARTQVAERFEKAVEQALDRGPGARRAAVLYYLGEMAEESGQRRLHEPMPSVGSGLLRRTLGRLRGPLMRQATAGEEDVARSAARTMGKLAGFERDVLADLGRLLAGRDTPAATRRAAAAALADLVTSPTDRPVAPLDAETIETRLRVAGLLDPGLRAGDAEVRRQCLVALFQLSRGWIAPLQVEGPGLRGVPPGEVARLRQAVQGRVDAVVAGLAPRLTPVAGLLEDEDVRVRLAACEALEAAGTLRSVLRRGELLPVQDPFAKGMAQVVPGLEKNLAHKEVRVRLGALYALETAGPESVKAAGTIVKAAGDDDAFVRWAAVRALGKIAPEAARQAVPALVKRLEDSSEDVRWTAALVLGRYGPAATEAAPALGKLIEKGRLALRLQAAAAVEAIGPKAAAAAPALVKALADTEVEVRRAAARALGRLDVAEKADVAAALRKALDDSDETVRQSAGRALLGEK